MARPPRCPHCWGRYIRPAPYRWRELPLALLLLRPWRCRECDCRFLRPPRLLRFW
jgi:hypothetical protein